MHLHRTFIHCCRVAVTPKTNAEKKSNTLFPWHGALPFCSLSRILACVLHFTAKGCFFLPSQRSQPRYYLSSPTVLSCSLRPDPSQTSEERLCCPKYPSGQGRASHPFPLCLSRPRFLTAVLRFHQDYKTLAIRICLACIQAIIPEPYFLHHSAISRHHGVDQNSNAPTTACNCHEDKDYSREASPRVKIEQPRSKSD